MPHIDSRGAFSTIFFQIQEVLGSLPLSYSTFFLVPLGFSKLREYDIQKRSWSMLCTNAIWHIYFLEADSDSVSSENYEYLISGQIKSKS
jgi:hypothetical protein